MIEITPPDGILATEEAPVVVMGSDGVSTFGVRLPDGRHWILAEEGGASQLLAWEGQVLAWSYACAVCAPPLEPGVHLFNMETKTDRLVLGGTYPALGQAVMADGQLLFVRRTLATGPYAGTLYRVDVGDPDGLAEPVAESVFAIPGSSQPLFAAGGGQIAWAELGSRFSEARWVMLDRERGTRVESPALVLDSPAGVAVTDGWLAWREPKGWRLLERQSGALTRTGFTTIELETAAIGSIGPATFIDGRLVWSAQVSGETRWFASQLGAP